MLWGANKYMYWIEHAETNVLKPLTTRNVQDNEKKDTVKNGQVGPDFLGTRISTLVHVPQKMTVAHTKLGITMTDRSGTIVMFGSVVILLAVMTTELLGHELGGPVGFSH